MNKIRIRYCFLYIILIAVLLTASLLTIYTKSSVISENSQLMEQASNKTKQCFDAVKEYKLENNIEIPDYDILETGMIGYKTRTSITSTEGKLSSKRTSTNPNWAAVIISYFEKCGLKENDQIGIICSGSFPALNIASVCAAEAYGLDYCLMISVGSSYYGANDPNFTNLEIFNLLYSKNLISKLPDLVSLGGANDIGSDFRNADEKNNIIERINNSSIQYLYEEDYETNINKRIDIFSSIVPNMKLLISCGGSLVAMGKENEAFLDNGLFKGDSYYNYSKSKNTGLLGYYKSMGVNVASLVNISYLALSNNIPNDPTIAPVIGIESNCNSYFVIKYKIYIPIIGIVLSFGLLSCIYIYRKRHKKELVSRK